jgi:DNA repair and recombination protein RAD52
MSGALSGHLIDSYNTIPPHRPAFAPFGTDISSANLSVHGPMSFLPSMHGTFQNQPPFGSTYGGDHSSMTMNMSEATALKIAQLQARLDKKLGPEYISTRPGPGGGTKLVYAEGWKIINLANEIFGFNGWSSSVVSLTVDFIDAQESVGKFSVGVTAIVRVTLRDGVFHEDIGYGMLENSKSKAQALDKVCLRLIGCIYASCLIL